MSVLLLTHRACLHHDPGPQHPECPDRLRSVLKALDAGEFADLIRDQAPLATEEQLTAAVIELRRTVDSMNRVLDRLQDPRAALLGATPKQRGPGE